MKPDCLAVIVNRHRRIKPACEQELADRRHLIRRHNQAHLHRALHAAVRHARRPEGKDQMRDGASRHYAAQLVDKDWQRRT